MQHFWAKNRGFQCHNKESLGPVSNGNQVEGMGSSNSSEHQLVESPVPEQISLNCQDVDLGGRGVVPGDVSEEGEIVPDTE